MKLIFFAIFISVGLLPTYLCSAQEVKPATTLFGVFDGRTPCRELAGQIHENTTLDCIKIKWRLALYKDSITGKPTTYSLLGFVYKKDSPRIGEWHIIKGTHIDPEAIIYQLDQAGHDPLFLQKGNDNVLFFLDRGKNIMVGNRDFSYTLNRVAKHF